MRRWALVDSTTGDYINKYAYVSADNKLSATRAFFKKWRVRERFPKEDLIRLNIETGKWKIIETPQPSFEQFVQ